MSEDGRDAVRAPIYDDVLTNAAREKGNIHVRDKKGRRAGGKGDVLTVRLTVFIHFLRLVLKFWIPLRRKGASTTVLERYHSNATLPKTDELYCLVRGWLIFYCLRKRSSCEQGWLENGGKPPLCRRCIE